MGAASAVPKAKTKPCAKCHKDKTDCRLYFNGWRCREHAPTEAQIRLHAITRYQRLQTLLLTRGRSS